ncbi:hypothetical protein [Aquipseudomonas guryensis]|uniref:Lipoprotein n=1 Tax=Aquipseudomonas guryensis TaxID=2759165 RepID=A0A7W4H494_9GAMM|nr:hypothetical protein [Pseudomonas guryensis]MBB1520375.1 hypothetical protein [Pseudomonas guryensis]
MHTKKLAAPALTLLLGACAASVSTSPCACMSQADIANMTFGIETFQSTPNEISQKIKQKFPLGTRKEAIDKELFPYSNGLCINETPQVTSCSFIFSSSSFSKDTLSIQLKYSNHATLGLVTVEKT